MIFKQNNSSDDFEHENVGSRLLTRRNAVILGVGAVAAATTAFIGLKSGSGGSGSVTPTISYPDGGGGSVTAGSGAAFGLSGDVYKVLYYEDNDIVHAGHTLPLNEIYGGESIAYFWEVCKKFGRDLCGQDPSTKLTSTMINPENGERMTTQAGFESAAWQAIDNAIARSPEATKARIVGFALPMTSNDGPIQDGWTSVMVNDFNGGRGYYMINPHDGFGGWSWTYASRVIDNYFYEGYFYRPPTTAECQGSFWDMKPEGTPYASYREKFWNEEWKGDVGYQIKSIIVVAVNDYESRPSGYAAVKKIPSM